MSRVEVRIASRESLQASYLRDLSLGGLFVRSKQPLAKGTEVVVELFVAGQPTARLRGTVVRHEQADDGTCRGFGVQFSTVDEETRTSLEQILREHQPPALSSPSTSGTELAELRGTLEAYEESLALLRESEMSLAQKLENADAERGVLEHVAQELQQRVESLENERAAMKTHVDALSAQMKKSEADTRALKDTVTRLQAELATARAAEAELKRLAAELEIQSGRSDEMQRQFEAEVAALRIQLETRDDAELRRELQELSAQLDDERLKSMALERALQRFSQMGGMVPSRS